jgi:hypothetical protein
MVCRAPAGYTGLPAAGPQPSRDLRGVLSADGGSGLVTADVGYRLAVVTVRWVAKDASAGRQAKPLDVLGLFSSTICTVSTVLAMAHRRCRGTIHRRW